MWPRRVAGPITLPHVRLLGEENQMKTIDAIKARDILRKAADIIFDGLEEIATEASKPEKEKPLLHDPTANKWLTAGGYVITLNENRFATHWCPGMLEKKRSGNVGWGWEPDGSIYGLDDDDLEDDLRIVGPAPELPELPDGWEHMEPPEFRCPRKGEDFFSRLDGETYCAVSDYKSKARWIVRKKEPVTPPWPEMERRLAGFRDMDLIVTVNRDGYVMVRTGFREDFDFAHGCWYGSQVTMHVFHADPEQCLWLEPPITGEHAVWEFPRLEVDA